MSAPTNWAACSISGAPAPGTVRRTIVRRAHRLRVVDPVVQAAPPQRVVQIAAAIGGQHHHRRSVGDKGTQFRHCHRGLTQEFQQQRLEFVFGTVDLVDQQYRRRRPAVPHALQDRPVHQIRLGVQVGLVDARCRAPRPAGCSAADAGSSSRRAPRRPSAPRSTAGASAAHRAQPPGSSPRRLADARFALQQQRPPECDRQVDRGRRADVQQVIVGVEASDHVVDIGERRATVVSSRHRCEQALVVVPGVDVERHRVVDGNSAHRRTRPDSIMLPHALVAVQLGQVAEHAAAQPERVTDAVAIPAHRDRTAPVPSAISRSTVDRATPG